METLKYDEKQYIILYQKISVVLRGKKEHQAQQMKTTLYRFTHPYPLLSVNRKGAIKIDSAVWKTTEP